MNIEAVIVCRGPASAFRGHECACKGRERACSLKSAYKVSASAVEALRRFAEAGRELIELMRGF